MEEKKPSTADILAKIRAQKAAAAAEAPAAAPETPAAVAASETAPTAAAPTPVTPKPAAVPGAKPGSTKEILAAIRAGGAKPAAAPVASTTAAPAASAAPAANVTPTPAALGPKLSPQEMLQKMREAKGAGAAAVAPAAAATKTTTPVTAPPIPAKPVPAGKAGKPTAVRRGMASFATVAAISAICFLMGFASGSSLLIAAGALAWGALLSPFMAAWAALAGVSGIGTLGIARFMFPNVLVEPPSKFKVGPLSDYPLNTVSNKWKDQFGIWVVHTDQYEGRNMIFALASVCTHLGCTPNWLDGEQKFKCPCHGSGFYMTGINFEGPAPRPLERMGLRIAEDGMLEVNKSVKYQEEMGQWTDTTSYVEVV